MIILSGTANASSATTAEVEFDGRNLVGADGSGISQWDDSSGNGRHAVQANPAQQPTLETNELNGHSVGRWADTGDQLAFSGNADSTPFTVVAVMKCTNSASPRTVLGANTGTNIPQIRINSNKIELVRANVVVLATSTTALSTSAFYTIGVTYDGATGAYQFFLNGSADGSGTATAIGFARFSLIGCSNGNQERFNGDIFYTGLWNSVLSSGELTTRFDDLRTVGAHY